ncbi:MAG: di-heme oxidoredictase family protein [Pseudomonadota bacterium]
MRKLTLIIAIAMLAGVGGTTLSGARDPSLLDGHEPGGHFLTFDPVHSAAQTTLPEDTLGEALFFRDWTKSHNEIRSAAGPQLDAPSCASCHIEIHARHRHQTDATAPFVVKPATYDQLQRFGAQLNTSATDGHFAEVDLHVEYETSEFRYTDGQTVALRRPTGWIDDPEASNEIVVLRATPLIYGWGLLERVDQDMVRHYADPDDKNGDGVSGEVSVVGDSLAIMGWKNGHTTMESQVATALANDMGVQSWRSCGDDCAIEISETELSALSDYVRRIGVPDRRALPDLAGQHLFGQAGCNQCHVPVLITKQTSEAWNSKQTLWPYSDLLLHDMGEGLADPTSAADRREWRTAPLWGIGIVEQYAPNRGFLHDGRARTIEEAILWHGGEARQSRKAFAELTQSQRAALLTYVRAL